MKVAWTVFVSSCYLVVDARDNSRMDNTHRGVSSMELNWYRKLLVRLASRILMKYRTVEIRVGTLIQVGDSQYLVDRTEQYAGGQVELHGEEVEQYLDKVTIKR